MVDERESARVDSTHKDALAAFLEVFSPEWLDDYVQLGERMTCNETEALAGLFAAHGHPATAQTWIEAHQTDCTGSLGRHEMVYDPTQVGAFKNV